MKHILLPLILIFSQTVCAQDYVKTTDKGVLFVTKTASRIGIMNTKTEFKYAPRDLESFDHRGFLKIFKETFFSLYKKNFVELKPVNSVYIDIHFDNGTGHIRKLYISIMSQTDSVANKLDEAFVDERFIYLLESLQVQLKNFTIWSQDRDGKYSGFQFVYLKKDIDEYLKACSAEKQP
jgi:hypothetical protein